MRDYIISSVQETNLTNKNGVYQDSLIAYDRDASGRIWAILGHTNLGGISVWSGESLCRIAKEVSGRIFVFFGGSRRCIQCQYISGRPVVPWADLAMRAVDPSGYKPLLLLYS